MTDLKEANPTAHALGVAMWDRLKQHDGDTIGDVLIHLLGAAALDIAVDEQGFIMSIAVDTVIALRRLHNKVEADALAGLDE